MGLGHWVGFWDLQGLVAGTLERSASYPLVDTLGHIQRLPVEIPINPVDRDEHKGED